MSDQRIITLGISPCPNDVFIFGGILLGKVETNGLAFEAIFEDVETLNCKAQTGAVDVLKISYAAYPICSKVYQLLSAGGALGRGVGPLLLSADGKWDAERETLVPGEHTTANFLLDFYAEQRLTKRFLPFDTLYEKLRSDRNSQGVVIHEKRFTYQLDGLHLIADLGTCWEDRTGFPIPLGAIVMKRSLGLEEVLNSIIRSSVSYAYAHYDEVFSLCREHSQELSDSVIASHIDLFVNNYSVDLGEDGRAAVKFFLERIAK